MRAIGFQADVTDAMTLNTAVQQIVDEWGRLDIATCNAGGGSPRRHAHRSSRKTLSTSSSHAISPARSTPAGPLPRR
ncbi:SDR family oxidoreductase [Rhodococcus baikonurensis]|uniref:SDR family oxidoreductase n=1 Tax=Rhodococcus baikonurensis TaxID=172041 RepID=UPI0037B58B52